MTRHSKYVLIDMFVICSPGLYRTKESSMVHLPWFAIKELSAIGASAREYRRG